jgi:hypothetical protein
MSRMTNESVRAPHQERFEPTRRTRKKESLRWRIAKKIALGLLCSCIATAIFKFADLKNFVLASCSIANRVFGDPIGGKEGIAKKFEDKIDHALEKTPHIGVPGGSGPKVSPLHKSPDQLKAEADLKEVERKRREESEMKTLIARAEAIGLEFEDDWTLEKFRVEVPRAEHEAEETAKKKPLLARADKIGLEVDPTADSKTLKHQVEEGEKEVAADADYQAKRRQYERDLEAWKRRVESGPNAVCPNNKCRHTMHFPQSRIGTQFICSGCNGIFPVRMAMARWTPPRPPKEPLPPKKNPGLWRRIFG